MLFNFFLLMKELSYCSDRDTDIVLTVYQWGHKLDSGSIRVPGLCHRVLVALHAMGLARPRLTIDEDCRVIALGRDGQ